jgi:hypothetical protein
MVLKQEERAVRGFGRWAKYVIGEISVSHGGW